MNRTRTSPGRRRPARCQVGRSSSVVLAATPQNPTRAGRHGNRFTAAADSTTLSHALAGRAIAWAKRTPPCRGDHEVDHRRSCASCDPPGRARAARPPARRLTPLESVKSPADRTRPVASAPRCAVDSIPLACRTATTGPVRACSPLGPGRLVPTDPPRACWIYHSASAPWRSSARVPAREETYAVHAGRRARRLPRQERTRPPRPPPGPALLRTGPRSLENTSPTTEPNQCAGLPTLSRAASSRSCITMRRGTHARTPHRYSDFDVLRRYG